MTKSLILTDTQSALVEDSMYIVKYMVYKKMRDILSGYMLDFQEAEAIANECLCRSVQTYDPDKGVKFTTYAARLIYLTLLSEATRKQKKRMQHEISLDTPIDSTDEEDVLTLKDMLVTAEEDPCCSHVWVKDTLASIDPRVRPFFAGEMNQTEIARKYGMSNALVSRLVSRERERLQKEIREQM
jgi:RNA polymerase sporulation-specific sigma factor